MGLRYFTFRSDSDIEKIYKNGIFKVEENFNECFLWELANFYFKEGSVIWGFAYEDRAPDMNSYMDKHNIIEFIPDKFLLFTVHRHEILRGTLPILMGIEPFQNKFKMCRNNEEVLKLEESILKYELGMTDKFLEYCGTEKSLTGEYIIMFPYIKKEQIINITRNESINDYTIPIIKNNDDNSDDNKEYNCIFCKDKGCPVCKLSEYIME